MVSEAGPFTLVVLVNLLVQTGNNVHTFPLLKYVRPLYSSTLAFFSTGTYVLQICGL